ncbi:hypothetical protein ACRQ1B_07060 [Rhizobium panacihumi]|uniref:hypothetical protein n=1 Tax=Rhizobium panacihumi TaxID=2008450 RepID=UPI003D7B2E51
MTHRYSDDIDLKLIRLRDVRRSALPLQSDGEAIRLLLSAQDAFHTLICARDDEEDSLKADRLLQS